MKFRELRADEIEIRIGKCNAKGCSLLLYKDARCDMGILDESGCVWQRKHYECKGNLFCSVGILIGDKWIWKDDAGSESYTEKEKGEASDSFKRACVNWGIGRELYTAPFIWIPANKVNLTQKNNKYTTYDKFKVAKIEYKDNKISYLEIHNEDNIKVYHWNNRKATAPNENRITPEKVTCDKCGNDIRPVQKDGVKYTAQQAKDMMGGMCSKCYKAAKNGN